MPGLVNPIMQNVADPIERVFEILNFYRGNLIKSKFGCGCLLGKLASEISEEQPHIHQRIAVGFDTQVPRRRRPTLSGRNRFESAVHFYSCSHGRCCRSGTRLPVHCALRYCDTAASHPLCSASGRASLGRRTKRISPRTQCKKAHPRAKQKKPIAVTVAARNAEKRRII